MLADFRIYFRSGTVASDGNGVKTSCAAEHKTVKSTHAGDGNKEIENISENITENIRERNRCAVLLERCNICAAGNADIIENVNGDNNNAAGNERNGKIALCVLQLCVD